MKTKMGKIAVFAICVLVVLIVSFSSFKIVEGGYVGVVVKLGAIQDVVLNEGMHAVTPFITGVIPVSVRTQKAEVESSAASRDLQTINASVAVNYSVVGESASVLYKTVGLNYEAVIIMPAIQESVKAVTARYSAEELITKRQEVSAQIKEELIEKMTGYGLKIEALNITGLDFSDEFNRAIEAKQTAQQQALKAEQDLNRIRIEAQQQVEEAKAEAEATKTRADAEAYAIDKLQEQLEVSDQYIRYETIRRWNGQLPTVMGAGENILDISSILGSGSAPKAVVPSAE